MTRRQYRSPLMASVHETAEGLHAAGVMGKRTMREFDELCLTPVRPLRPKSSPPRRLVVHAASADVCAEAISAGAGAHLRRRKWLPFIPPLTPLYVLFALWFPNGGHTMFAAPLVRS